MPGNLVHVGAMVQCAHLGQATPTVPNPRVLVGQQPTVQMSAPWTVAGCPFPPNSGGPCVTAMWTVAATRVTSQGQPLVIATGMATCAPTGVPVTVTVVQPRVSAT